MIKNLIAISCIALSANANANCAATATNATGAVNFGNWHYDTKYKIAINNASGVEQTYEVCREGHAQFYDHTVHFSSTACDHYTIKNGEGLQKDLTLQVNTNFDKLKPHDRGVGLDAIIRIRGECNCDAHEHKVVPLIQG